ncbi:hypothetical protein V1525DRAFT_394711 [Lipomyces kononenkoae]|uniref:Uncharacterized protein n=1 Tax=Lipomyces kononenkoae TaxID=34357 RepID=A0ACC3T9P4_LIPKO
MSVRDIESFPIQKHSYCKVPFNNPPSSKSIPWTHSPYRDSLVIAFDPTVSEIVRIKVLWRSEILENVDVADIKKLNISSAPLTVIVRSPCIGIKYAYRELYGQIMVRRFQMRFANDELFTACLRQFEKYGCLVKSASGLSSMPGSQSIISSTQQSAASVTDRASQTGSGRSYCPSSLSSISSYGSQYLPQSDGKSPNVGRITSQPDLDAPLTQPTGVGMPSPLHMNSQISVTTSLSNGITPPGDNVANDTRLNDSRILSQSNADTQWTRVPASSLLSSVNQSTHSSYMSTPREYQSQFNVGNVLLNIGSGYRPVTDKPIIPHSPPRITAPSVSSPSKSTDSSYMSASNTSTNTIDSPISRTDSSVHNDYQKSLKMPQSMDYPISSADFSASHVRSGLVNIAGLDDKEIEKMIAECLKDPTFTTLLDRVSRVLKTSQQ